MGRKKAAARDEETLPAVAAALGGGKARKKAVLIDDDEYSIGTELTEEPQEEKAVNNNNNEKKKKGKKGNQKNFQSEDDDSKEDEGEENDEEIVFTGKKKSKGKKSGRNNVFSKSSFELLDGADKEEEEEEEDGSGDKDSEEEDVPVVSKGKPEGSSKKGGNKSGSLFSASAFGAIDGGSESELIDNEIDDMVENKSKKGGKKKSGKSGFSAAAFDLLGDESEEENEKKGEDVQEGKDEEDEPIIFTDKKKKSKKGGKKKGSTFDLLDDGDEDENEKKDEDVKEDNDEEDERITFSDKKKKSKKGAKKKNTAFDLIDNEDEGENEKKDQDVKEDRDEEDEPITFTDKKKKTKSSKKTGKVVLDEENVVEDAFVVTDVSGEVDKVLQNVESSNVESNASKASKREVVAEISKNKKKKEKSKSGRTVQEEDDLDKLLAELGGASTPQEKVQVQPPEPVAADEKGGEEEKEESAAAKKKKKKKEKEKEKKAVAAAAATAVAEDKQEGKTEAVESKKNDGKSKGPEKKMSKQVREMQEALARRKEAEERKKREEEERLRKEEEERKRQEELERQAEEAKRRKKEKEKEKLLKKKREGKLLTGRQKEEARRLEALRNQFLANGISLPTGDKETAPKRPKYQTKKKSSHHQASGAEPVKEESIEPKDKDKEKQETMLEMDVRETGKVEDGESSSVEEKPDIADAPKENGVEEEEEDDDDEDWDAKSWDDVNLNVQGAFDDEEPDSDSEPESLVNKEMKSAIPSPHDEAAKSSVAVKKAIPEQPVKKSQDAATRKKDAAAEDKAPEPDAMATPNQAKENLRSPICCIMGHVDTGKTKLLDCIRGTNVQEGEAGGITQQIGATYFPAENIRERTRELKADATLKVPGLLVIDTPGHESFTNLRSRGSGLCDIAILVVDIMHGLEPQTIESLNLLKMRNTEFIVALNKVDRLYGWKTCRNAPIVKAMKQQSKDVQTEFNMRLVQIITEFKEQGMNTELYYKNKERGETFNIVPTSAISGEGIPDLLLLLVQWTQKTMVEKLTFRNEVQCTVLEVKVIEGHGTTIDVVLVNGVLHEGDQIVVCGLQGPIVTTIRALLTPHPMKELRVKGTYLHHKQIKAAQGIKISAQGLEHAIAGTGLYVVGPDDDLEDVKEEAMEDMQSVMSRIDKSGEGVCVQASTLGSLEALLEFLKSDAVKIPVSGISIGPVHKKDVMRASVMLEKKKEFAAILAFDVKVTPDARELADELGVKVFTADIIYHLFDQFTAYINNLKEEKKKEAADEAVFPCVLKIMPNCVFNKKDPIVLGVDVLEGIAKVGTPICIPQREFIDIGRIASIENNHKPVDTAKKGQKVAIKIIGSNSEEQQKMFGRHFDIGDELVSHISRKSIDVLKANYREDLTMDEWKLVMKLKNLFKIL